MATTGQVFPNLAEGVSESPWLDEPWGLPGNITVDDTSYASITAATYDNGDQSDVLKAYNFNLSSIPVGATIVGVTCRVSAWRPASTVSIDLVQLLNTSRAKVGTNKAATPVALTASQATYTFGGAADLWGNALTEAWVKDADFGVALGFLATGNNADVSVDWVTLEIEYTLPPKSTAVARVSLASHGEPSERTNHKIKVRARTTSGSAGVIKAALYEGATDRSGELTSGSLSTSLANYSLSIPDANAENITDYSNLEIRLWGYSAAGDALTFEVAEVYLELPAASGPATYYGVVSMPITFGKAVAGTKKTFGQIAMPIAFAATVSGSRKVFGQIAFPITFAKSVAGQRKAFGQIAMPITFGKAVAGTKKTFGQIAMPITFGKAVAGTKKTFGQIAMPITFGKSVVGSLKAFGQTSLAITFGKETSGQRKTFGQLIAPFIFGKSVSGQRKTFGQTSMPITVTIAVAGVRVGNTYYGITSLPITFGKDVKGVRKTFGQIALPITFGKDVRGTRKTFGQIVFPIIFTPGVIGKKTAFGQLSMQTLFGKETAGQRKTFGQIAMPITFSKAVAGRKHTFGSLSLPIDVDIYVDGFGWLGPQTYYGELSMPITFNKQVSAQRKTFGQLLSPFIFGKSVQGRRSTFSELDFPLDLLFDVETGRVGAHGRIDFPIIVGITTDGRVVPIGTILNNAESLYLGSTPVLAVYVGDQQVWSVP